MRIISQTFNTWVFHPLSLISLFYLSSFFYSSSIHHFQPLSLYSAWYIPTLLSCRSHLFVVHWETHQYHHLCLTPKFSWVVSWFFDLFSSISIVWPLTSFSIFFSLKSVAILHLINRLRTVFADFWLTPMIIINFKTMMK